MSQAPCGQALNGAPDFLKNLKVVLNATSENDPIAVAVVGSVFGGTGASVLPTIVDALAESLCDGQTDVQRNRSRSVYVGKLRVVAVMMLPYFQPKDQSTRRNAMDAEDGEAVVDGTRFLLDTANTLKYYQVCRAAESFHGVYLLTGFWPFKHH